MKGAVWITGASSGIGLSCAQHFARLNHPVVGVARNAQRLTHAFSELPGTHWARAADVTDRQALVTTLEGVESLHAVIANAGLCRTARLDDATSDEVWKQVLDINLSGVYYTLHAAVPLLQEGGRVIVVSSGLGKLGRDGYCAYAASKHAVLGMVKCLAQELAPRKITVNAVCPGWVDTPMARGDIRRQVASDAEAEALYAKTCQPIPIGRWVASDEVAAMIGYLCSEQGAAVTGQALNISGGEFFA